MRKNSGQEPANPPGAAIVALGAARISVRPKSPVHNGNGIYEKTPRCPRDWSDRCQCLCTNARDSSSKPSPRCARSSNTRPHGCSRCGASSTNQEGDQSHQDGQISQSNQDRQEKNRQKGRQEQDREKDGLTLASGSLREAWPTGSKSPASAGVFLGAPNASTETGELPVRSEIRPSFSAPFNESHGHARFLPCSRPPIHLPGRAQNCPVDPCSAGVGMCNNAARWQRRSAGRATAEPAAC